MCTQNKDGRHVILINRVFEGSWKDKDGNVSHEIIDYFLADDKNHYVYNVPYGQCPSGKNKTATVDYVLLVGHGRNFPIYGYIEIKEQFLRDILNKKNVKKKDAIENLQQKLEEIKYCGKPIAKIFQNDIDNTYMVTFRGYEVLHIPKISLYNQHTDDNESVFRNQQSDQWEIHLNGQFRNSKYVDNEENFDLYDKLKKFIKPDNEIWEQEKLRTVDENSDCSEDYLPNTFLDLINKDDNEECYTNIFYALFTNKIKDKRCGFDEFLEFLNESKNELKTHNTFKNDYNAFAFFDTKTDGAWSMKIEKITKSSAANAKDSQKEQHVDESKEKQQSGRIDIFAESEGTTKTAVIIENKINSGINGPEKNQLEYYYKWAQERVDNKILILLTVPDANVKKLQQELAARYENNGDTSNQKLKEDVKNSTLIVPYSIIRDFVKKEKLNGHLESWQYKSLTDQIISLLNRHSEESQQTKFENLFKAAIRDIPS